MKERKTKAWRLTLQSGSRALVMMVGSVDVGWVLKSLYFGSNNTVPIRVAFDLGITGQIIPHHN